MPRVRFPGCWTDAVLTISSFPLDSDFSLTGYAALLDGLAARGYAAVGYGDIRPEARHLVLRHDIDVSPACALPLAEAEAARGMQAFYFILAGGELYNPASRDSRAVIAALQALGHRIGLHFDASVYAADADLDAAAAAECRLLEDIAGTAVEMISFHRPAPALLGNPAALAGRPHTYQPRYFSEIGYCSDSRGGWHSGHPFAHAAIAGGRAMQLLTHPVWWSGAASPQAALEDFLRQRCHQLDQYLGQNVTTHAAGRLGIKFGEM